MFENNLRALYRILDHKGFKSRIGWLHFPTKEYRETYISTEEEAVEIALKYDGTHNIFIGRAARSPDGSFHHASCCTFDIDPIRPKDMASTDEQHKWAIEAGRRILKEYPGGYLASSGNGVLLVYRLPKPITDNAYYEKEKVFISELQEIAGDKVRVDATGYSSAVIKAIGTFSTKGEIAFRRCSRFLDYPILPYRNCPQLLQRLNDIKPSQQLSTQAIDVAGILSKFNGDRSVADFHLVRYFKQSGLGPEDALKALQANSLGRQTDEKDQARLIAKIYGTNGTQQSDRGTSDYFTNLFAPAKDSQESIRTGFSELDTALGPLPNGELTTFAARSGFGKTTFGCTLAEYWRKQGKRVLFFSTEMAEEYIMHKLVSLSCEIPLGRTLSKSFTANEIERIRSYEQELLRSPITIVDTFKPTLQEVHNKIIQCKPDVLIFDHITQSSTSWQEVAEFTRGIKDVTTQENITAVLLSMLNEPPRKQDGTVSTSVRGDVRGSQEIVFLSAIFCLLANPYEIKGRFQPVDVLVAKNRYGISNQTIPLTCDKEISKFIERNKSHEPNEM